MRGITVWQPYADDILDGIKTIENRVWSTEYRGPLIVHTGQRYAAGGRDRAHGVVLGFVHLVGVHEAHGGTHVTERGGLAGRCCRRASGALTPAEAKAEQLWHLELESPRRLPVPVPWRGRERLWVPSTDLLRLLSRATRV